MNEEMIKAGEFHLDSYLGETASLPGVCTSPSLILEKFSNRKQGDDREVCV